MSFTKQDQSQPATVLKQQIKTNYIRTELITSFPRLEGFTLEICLKLILVNGKTSEFIVPYLSSVGDVSEYVYNNWPEDWLPEKDGLSSHKVLKLIYQGRFLHENVTFVALNILPGKKVVMHLVQRETLPQLYSEDPQQNCKTAGRSCCCAIL